MYFYKKNIIKRSQTGFTLIELLITITIMGIIASIILVSLGESREKARNANVIQQMAEYQKALELYYADNGVYPSGWNTPSLGLRNRILCISDNYVDGTPCLPTDIDNGSSPQSRLQNDNINSLVKPALRNTMSSLPGFIVPAASGPYTSPGYSGCTGTSNHSTNCSESDYSLWFVLEGTNRDCGKAIFIQNSSDGFTMCRLMPGS